MLNEDKSTISISLNEYYTDALPETSEDITLKHLARYLEAQRFQQRLHRSHLPTFLSPVHKKHDSAPQLDHQKTRELLEVLADKLRQKVETNHVDWTNHRHRTMYDPILQIAKQEAKYFFPHYHLGYPEEKPNENDDRFTKNLDYGRTFDVDRGMMEESVPSFYGKHNHVMGVLHYEGGSEAAPMQSATNEPEFTYKFDKSNLKEKHPFAVKPNDPRYYKDVPFSSGKYSLFDCFIVQCLEHSFLYVSIAENFERDTKYIVKFCFVYIRLYCEKC
jgi:hypothetical protein